VIDEAERALRSYGDLTERQAALLLPTWAYYDQLTIRDRLGVVARFMPDEHPRDEHRTTVRQLPGGPVEARCSCGQWSGVAPSSADAERDAAEHRRRAGGVR
jgi:hypothetical protein